MAKRKRLFTQGPPPWKGRFGGQADRRPGAKPAANREKTDRACEMSKDMHKNFTSGF